MAKHILFPAVLLWIFALNGLAQCPELNDANVIDHMMPLCEGSDLTFIVSGVNLAVGSTVDWYLTEGTQNPYLGEGVLLGQAPVTGDPCENEPEVLYIMVNPDNAQVGGSGDQCDEFIVMWTGSGGYLTSDILVSNLGPGTFEWDNYVAGNAANFSCGTALPPGPVPENAILLIQSSPNNNVFIDIDNLCDSGLPVYIIAYDGTGACTGGYFDNSSPCSSCPVMIDIDGLTCQFELDLNYMPPGSSIDGWAWGNNGSGVFGDVVPVLDIPVFEPPGILVEDYEWTVPFGFCDNFTGSNYFIVGIPNPPPMPGCIQVTTPYFGIGVQCGTLVLSGGGDVCEGNCPTDPTEINFEIEGTGAPFLADIIITASAFPPFEIEDLEISNGQAISVCLGGFFPSFDPSTGILNIPSFAIGITATVEIASIFTTAGCPVTVDPNFLSLTFIGAPSANAGGDETICVGETVELSGSIGGTGTGSFWTTAGDGSFDDPTQLDAIYTPGPTDILNGQVVLTLSAMDPNGTCIPATSTMTVTIDPTWIIELGPAQTVCNTDIVNIMAVITGPPTTGIWSSTGDGEFDAEASESTFYEPGPDDLATGSVTLFYTMDNNGPCTAPSEPLQVTFVNAPIVNLPTNIEVCTEDSVTIHIGLNGSYTNVQWFTAGDGVLLVMEDIEVNYTPGPNDIDNQFVIVSVSITSSFPECGVTTYNLPINIIFCDCPPFQTDPAGDPLCSVNSLLDLTTLLEEGGSGSWSITVEPTGGNPAFLVGDIFTTDNSDPGLYTVTYTLDAPEPGCPATSSEQILVAEPIIPFAGPNLAFCGYQTVQLEGTLTPATPAQVQWQSLGDGVFSNSIILDPTYTPGSADSLAGSISLVLHVVDTVCGNQRDTVTLFFSAPPVTLFPNDTFSICNTTENGSILNFSALIAGGDATGTWTNTSGVPVDFSDPTTVDFNGVAEGYYLFQYETNSAVSPCGERVYDIIIHVDECDCPLLLVTNAPEGICNTLDSLPLNAFVMAGAPGSYMIVSSPPGLNPATISGSFLVIDGCDPGLYIVRFTFDAAPIVGCPDSADIEIVIQESLTLNLSGDTSTCGQVAVQLDAEIGGSATGVIWSTSGTGMFQDPMALSTIYTPSILDVASASVLLIANAVDTLGYCPIPADTITMFLVTPPSTTFTALTDTLCTHPDSGSVINLFSFIVEGDGTGFWTDLDGSMVDLTNPSMVDFDGVAEGSYRLVYTTQTALAPCTDSMYTFTVVLEDCGCPPLDISPGILTLCQGTSADLNDQIINAAPGMWSIQSGPFGDWPDITGSILTSDNAAGGNYVLIYTLTDSVPECRASAPLSMIIEEPVQLTVIDLICDADQLFYEVLLQTNAGSITSDFGINTTLGPGEYSIDGVPAGQNIQLMASGSSGMCDWIFNVTAPDCNCTLFIEDIADTIRFCPGDTFVLIPLVTGAQGLPFSTWITPDGTKMQPTLPLYEEGDYIWIVRDMAGCEERDSFYVEFLGPQGAEIISVAPTCPGNTDGQIIVESVLGGDAPFLLQLDNGPVVMADLFPYVFTDVSIGLHEITITDIIGCTLELQNSLENADFGVLDLGPDVVIYQGDSTLIRPSTEGIAVMSVMWTPSFPGQDLSEFWFTPELTTIVSAIVQDSAGCVYEDQLLITVLVEETVYIPNVFSPNGDGINDVVSVSTNLPDEQLLSFEIYDRWGGLVYSQNSMSPFQWDGNSQGQPSQSGVYVYKFLYKNNAGNIVVITGDITLLK